MRHLGPVKREFERQRPGRSCEADEGRGRVDAARGADRHEQIGAGERCEDLFHAVGHFSEPDDIGPAGRRAAAGAGGILGVHLCGRVPAMPAGRAKRPLQLSVHVPDRAAAGALVQIVDVLRDDQHLAGPVRLQPGQRGMRRVRRRAGQIGAAGIVEVVHQPRVAREALGCRHLLQIVLRPDPAHVAKRAKPAFGRDSRAGQDDDPLHGGLIRKADREAAIAAGVIAPARDGAGEDAEPACPAFSARLTADLEAVARAARQHAVLAKPDLLLDLLAFQLSGRAGHRAIFALRHGDVANAPGTATGFAPDPRIAAARHAPADPWTADRARAFRAFRKTGKARVRGELAQYLAQLLDLPDSALGRLIDKEAKTAIRAIWTPTAENFFIRVRGAYLDALWREMLGLPDTHPTATTFARLKKRAKAETLEALFADPAEQDRRGCDAAAKARIAQWLPEPIA
jgi:hypothetical protein